MLRLSRALRVARTQPRFAAPEGVTNRLLLTLGSPTESYFKDKPVDSVSIPGAEGEMTLSNNHSQLVSALKPGTITVKDGSNVETFFCSDGWAFMNAPGDDSGCCTAAVSCVECVPVAALDKDRAQQVLSEVLSGPKDTEWDKAKIQLATSLCGAVLKVAQ